METTKYLILGAGISGLSLAYFLKNENYHILEQENSVGGFCRTTYQDGYTWDYAGHFFHFKHSDIEHFFMSRIDKEGLIYNKKNTKIYLKNKYIDYPFQKNIHQLNKEDFISCLYDLYFRENHLPYNNFEKMLYGKFGKSITNLFLKPYNEKLYSCDLNKLDVEAMGRFFPYADINDIISNMKYQNNNSYNNEFLYHKKGAQVFVDALSKEISRKRLALNEKILSIDAENKVVKTTKQEYRYEYLINTTMFPQLLKWVEPDSYLKYKETLTYNKVCVFNLGFDLESYDKDVHWIYYPEKKYDFYRVGFYNNILHEKPLSLYVELGYKPEALINKEEALEKILDGLKKAGIIYGHKLISYQYLEMVPAYVHISKESNLLVKQKLFEFKDKNIYSIGRYGGWKYSSIEDAIVEAKDLVPALRKKSSEESIC